MTQDVSTLNQDLQNSKNQVEILTQEIEKSKA